jgi:hypothetical protein
MARIRSPCLASSIRVIRAIRCFYVLIWAALASWPRNDPESIFSCWELAARIHTDSRLSTAYRLIFPLALADNRK